MFLTLFMCSQLRKKVMTADSKMSWDESTDAMKKMCTVDWDDDKAVLQWLAGSDSAVGSLLSKVKYDAIAKMVSGMLDGLSADQRSDLLAKLR